MGKNNSTKNSDDVFNNIPEFKPRENKAISNILSKPLTLEQKELFFRKYEADDEKFNSLINPILDIFRWLFLNIIKHNKQKYMKYRKINNHKKNKQKWIQNL